MDRSQTDKDKQDWIDTDKRLIKEVTDATNRLREAVAVVEGEAFKQKETLVNEWNSTIDARAWMTGAVDASKIINKKEKELEGLAAEYAVILDGRMFAEQEIANLSDEINAIDVLLDKEQDKASVYENAQTIVGLLESISDGRKAIVESTKDIDSQNHTLNDELLPALISVEDKVKQANEVLGKANRTSNSLTAVLTTLNSAKESYNANKTKLDAFLANNECLSAERLSELDAYKSSDIIGINRLAIPRAAHSAR